MSGQRHVIKRQVVEVTVADAAGAPRLLEEVSRICRERVTPLLERVCGKTAGPDCLVRIDRLQIDLGEIEAGNLEEELIETLGHRLAEELGERLRRADSGGTEATPRTASWVELAAVFAWTGSLPWWADASRLRLVDEALLSLVREAPRLLARLVRKLALEERPLARLAAHCEERTLAAVVAALAPEAAGSPSELVGRIEEWLRQAESPAGVGRARLRDAMWQGILAAAGRMHGGEDSPGWWREALRQAAARTRDGRVAEVLRRAGEGPRRVLASGERQPPVEPENQEQEAEGPGAPVHGRKEQGADVPRSPGREETEPFDVRFADAEDVPVGHAGLVLLWPFLGEFFKRLGLVEEGAFQDGAALQRGVGLLGFLATGEAALEEYQLPLTKVLCGMEPDEVFDFGDPVTEEEAAESAALLEAVIGHAAVLRSLSVTGLRGTFLIRPGVLSSRDGGWLLRVERRTYDIVLERLPWSVGWVKLPWMEAPLQVEWR